MYLYSKPPELLNQFIENSSNKNDIIPDLFMNTGTSSVDCLTTNKKFIEIEIDSQYYDIVQNWITNVK